MKTLFVAVILCPLLTFADDIYVGFIDTFHKGSEPAVLDNSVQIYVGTCTSIGAGASVTRSFLYLDLNSNKAIEAGYTAPGIGFNSLGNNKINPYWVANALDRSGVGRRYNFVQAAPLITSIEAPTKADPNSKHLVIFKLAGKNIVTAYQYSGNEKLEIKARGSEKVIPINNGDIWGSCLYSQKIFPEEQN
ncbi:hypothetical protein K2P97_10410 [bacterium]|nr:hypothetical protein [bacterium]